MKIEDLKNMIEENLRGIDVEITTREPNIIDVKVSRDKIIEVAEKLKGKGFDHVKSVTAVDYPGERFEVIYIVSSYEVPLSYFLVSLRTSLPYDDPRMSSLLSVWPSVLYQEHEEHDLMGIEFEGNPRMGERLLLPESYEGIPPLRKEFKVKVEGIDA